MNTQKLRLSLGYASLMVRSVSGQQEKDKKTTKQGEMLKVNCGL